MGKRNYSFLCLLSSSILITACGEGFESKSDGSASGSLASIDILDTYVEERKDAEFVMAVVQEKTTATSSASSGEPAVQSLRRLNAASTAFARQFRDDPRYLIVKEKIEACAIDIQLGVPSANQMTTRLVQPCALDVELVFSFQEAVAFDPNAEVVDPAQFLPPDEFVVNGRVRILDAELLALFNYVESTTTLTIRMAWSEMQILNAEETRISMPFGVNATGSLQLKNGRTANLTVRYVGNVVMDADANTMTINVTGNIRINGRNFSVRIRAVSDALTGETVDATVILNGVEIPYAELPEYLGIASSAQSSSGSASSAPAL